MSGNPDFSNLKKIKAVAERIHDFLAQHGAPRELLAVIDLVVADLEARDEHLEDWLNNNVVRRIHTAQDLGDNTLHDSTGWMDVSPTIALHVVKASSRSRLNVQIAANGLFGDGAPPHWVDVGVRIQGPGGYDAAVGIVRKTGDINPQEMVFVGGKECAIGVPAGVYLVTLRTKVETAGVGWFSTPANTMSMTVTETPSP